MIPIPSHGNPIVLALMAIGKLPENCTDARINMPTSGVLKITYDVLLTQNDLRELSAALAVQIEKLKE